MLSAECVPVTEIVIMCSPGARPETENTTSDVRLPGAAGPAVSTVVGAPPSMDTVAIPQTLHLTPTQLSAVPVKLNVAVEPAVLECKIRSPLNVPVPGPEVFHAPRPPAYVATLSSYAPWDGLDNGVKLTSAAVVPRMTRS